MLRAFGVTLLAAIALAPLTTRAATPSAKGDVEVVLETSLGNVTVKLFADKAPKSVANFLGYVDGGFYDGTIFHRIIDGFMVQGGGYTADLNKKSGLKPNIENEAANGLKNKRGTLALARTGDPHSANSQFFINVVDNFRLDHTSPDPRGFGYCVFGEVTAGMDIVDKARVVPTCPKAGPSACTQPLPPGMGDVPATPVVLKKAYRKKAKK